MVVTAWGTQAGDGVAPNLSVGVDALRATEVTRGGTAVRQQLVDLHALMLGQEYPLDHPEIDAAYALLIERWRERQAQGGNNNSSWDWENENCRVDAQLTDEQWQQVNADPNQMVNSWSSVLLYLMTHFDYLYE